jgi:hypothetical protein
VLSDVGLVERVLYVGAGGVKVGQVHDRDETRLRTAPGM